MKKNIEIIRIEWDGPYSLNDIGYDEEIYSYKTSNILNDMSKDKGIYQVYGYHPVYGDNVLLYIGKTIKQTFAKRLSKEGWEYNHDYKNIQIYVGRLFEVKQPSIEHWENMISKAEQMLIYAHSPAKNSSNILSITKSKDKLQEFEKIRVLNYDNHRSLMPEVTGELWVKGFDNYKGVFGSEDLLE